MIIAALTLTADRTLKIHKDHYKLCYLVQEINWKLGHEKPVFSSDDDELPLMMPRIQHDSWALPHI